jgi:hypothetical protein
MKSERARIWQEMMALSPLCSGSLNEQYLACGKPICRCHDKRAPQRHGPYYKWQRVIGGKVVSRTLRPGPELERVRQGIANYHRAQELFRKLLAQDESELLGRGVGEVEGKKNFKRRLEKR